MGGSIYQDRLVAVRELVQNAVDACKLRDALTQLFEGSLSLNTDHITVEYQDSSKTSSPKLVVTDHGTGMDGERLERFFLRVGRSYYTSSEFLDYRIQLKQKNLDFAPVSEFGIRIFVLFSAQIGRAHV